MVTLVSSWSWSLFDLIKLNILSKLIKWYNHSTCHFTCKIEMGLTNPTLLNPSDMCVCVGGGGAQNIPSILWNDFLLRTTTATIFQYFLYSSIRRILSNCHGVIRSILQNISFLQMLVSRNHQFNCEIHVALVKNKNVCNILFSRDIGLLIP